MVWNSSSPYLLNATGIVSKYPNTILIEESFDFDSNNSSIMYYLEAEFNCNTMKINFLMNANVL